MKFLIIVAAIFGSIFSIQCASINQERVIGGRPATSGQFPWNAAIHDGSTYICSGALISEYFVLTSAECVVDLVPTPDLITVRLGSLSPDFSPTEARSVWHIVTHPAYWNNETIPPQYLDQQNRDDVMHHNNIAIVMLRDPVQFTDTIKPVTLPQVGTDPVADGTEGIVCGWGHEFETTISQLEFVHLQTMNVDICIVEAGGNPTIDHDRNLCTASYSAGSPVGACSFDHGAPLTSYNPPEVPILLGLVSYANCEPEVLSPTIYASVVGHRFFIFKATGL